MAKSHLPSPETLRQLLRYDPETGKLFWRPRGPHLFVGGSYDPERRAASWNKRYAGKEAGTDNGAGYICTRVFARSFKAHHLVWAMANGRWPEAHLDHINGVRSDNRIENLREVSRTENNRNAKLRADNVSGVCGVRKRNGVWVANIRGGGRQKFLGQFKTKEQAAAARREAERRLGYSPRHGKVAPCR